MGFIACPELKNNHWRWLERFMPFSKYFASFQPVYEQSPDTAWKRLFKEQSVITLFTRAILNPIRNLCSTICLKCQADHAAPLARKLQAARLARSPQPTAGCRLGFWRDKYTDGVSAETGKWPWFVSPCGQMKLLVRASTWHFAFVTILPFQGADRVPFKIQGNLEAVSTQNVWELAFPIEN